MPLAKTIVKSNKREVVIKYTGNGIETITLASLVSSGQTISGFVPPAASISSVIVNQINTGFCTITRNNAVALQTFGDFNLTVLGFFLEENSGSDIVVNLSTDGTLILRLLKTQGYSA